MPKSLAIQSFLDAFTQKNFGRDRTSAMDEGICVICGKAVEGFTDAFSAREWEISGLCQNCQDSTFNEAD